MVGRDLPVVREKIQPNLKLGENLVVVQFEFVTPLNRTEDRAIIET